MDADHFSNHHDTTPEDLLKKLMNTYGDDVLRLAYVYVKDLELAKDMAQDVFLKCFKHLGEFREESSYKTWLLKITVNHCKDYLRSGYNKYIRVGQAVGELLKSNRRTPEEALLQKVERDTLTHLVLNLPQKYSEVTVLFYYQELSIEEIALLLEKNPNTIKTRLRTARDKLRKSYSHYERSDQRG